MPAAPSRRSSPTPKDGSITGIVWRDFSPGGGTPGKVEQGELGIPGARVDLLDSSGKTVQSTKTRGERLVRVRHVSEAPG